jgi:hypothetical protein
VSWYDFSLLAPTRPLGFGLCVVLALGCSRRRLGASASATGGPAGTTGLDAGDTGDAGAPGQGATPIPLIDSPPWPAGARRVILTWVVHPPAVGLATAPSDPSNEALVPRPIELHVRAGSVTRSVPLNFQAGTVPRKYQRPCALKLGPEALKSAMALRSPEALATLAFGSQGDYGYEVRRDTRDTIAVLAFSQDDGICPGGETGDVSPDAQGSDEAQEGAAQPCPRTSVVVGRMQIPESATFEEQLIGIDRTRKEFPFCQGHAK